MLTLVLASTVCLGALDAPTVPAATIDPYSDAALASRFDVPRLRQEYAQLKKKRPSYGLGVTLLIAGSSLAGAGAVYGLIALSTRWLLVLAVASASIGVAAIGFGIVSILYRSRDRALWHDRLEALDDRIRTLEQLTLPPFSQGGPLGVEIARF